MNTTPEIIRALITRELSLEDLPMDLTFGQAGFSVNDLVRIQIKINRTFSRTVSKVLLIDNCFTLTDRFNEKK